MTMRPTHRSGPPRGRLIVYSIPAPAMTAGACDDFLPVTLHRVRDQRDRTRPTAPGPPST